VYPDRVRHNIKLAIKMIGTASRLRPHVKTHKSHEVTQLMLDAGIDKFKCATIAEAEMLAQCGAPDVLLAYQPLGPKLNRFVTLMQQYPATRFSCIVDDKYVASDMSAQFSREGFKVPVYIDLNVGMDRTGISGDRALDLYASCLDLPGLSVRGIHAYDGQINDADFAIRKKRCDEAFGIVERVHAQIQGSIICGGSPTFSIHCQRPDVECSPGTFVYWDQGYLDHCPEQPFLPAVVLLARVISKPSDNHVCIDLGHKSIASENPIGHRVSFLNATGITPVKHSEEHMVLELQHTGSLVAGDILYALPFHVCPTVALYERMLAVSQGEVVGEWQNIARNRKLTI
jgi:D-serine deaminase-like pyridoxal phosphate-dependent protein